MQILVSEEILNSMIKSVSATINDIDSTIAELNRTLKQTGIEWKDKKYIELEELIIGVCTRLKSSRSYMVIAKVKLEKSLQAVLSYLSSSNSNPSIGKSASSVNLCETAQTIHLSTLPNGQIANIFDHPNSLATRLHSSQGNNSYSMDGTCSLVSTANILTIAGEAITEQQIVDYARSNNLCSREGGTDARFTYLSSIWGHYGLSPTASFDYSPQDLATMVESGRGVVISVDSGVLWNQGNQNFNAQVDHAIIVTSTARDPQTGELLGFYICDSGRCVPSDGSRFVDMQMMHDMHFDAINHGMLYTNNVIW